MDAAGSKVDSGSVDSPTPPCAACATPAALAWVLLGEVMPETEVLASEMEMAKPVKDGTVISDGESAGSVCSMGAAASASVSSPIATTGRVMFRAMSSSSLAAGAGDGELSMSLVSPLDVSVGEAGGLW